MVGSERPRDDWGDREDGGEEAVESFLDDQTAVEVVATGEPGWLLPGGPGPMEEEVEASFWVWMALESVFHPKSSMGGSWG